MLLKELFELEPSYNRKNIHGKFSIKKFFEPFQNMVIIKKEESSENFILVIGRLVYK